MDTAHPCGKPQRELGLRPLLLITMVVATTGCEPSSEQTCETLLACEETHTDRVALDDCTASCLVQQRLYDEWEDIELQDSFTDYKFCIAEESCEEIAAGACYNADLYSW